ncbi:MAG: response regulator [Candidatus Marinimicrobia bacterium]|jgi:signal transduction histidine kinase/CheY-like chemotaxis protein|nr:response regulator [Candidatus Neomarinimicrobiota bacterium]MBT3632985.1 response regulator [Candidatus Neomarinimicrobiota bacterium]MBT3682095.1 response regulator [Candidatus Neomarinimicrobiota bacterium]MBT3760773.1 response regulator [Candidatus Neomarinimicrobiota bacterium]MBT3895225.1 response regulator [Candidatus Neomarinimicrobiota bacterium]
MIDINTINIQNHLTDAILLVKPNFNIIDSNISARAIFNKGYQIERKSCYELLRNKTEACSDCPLNKSISNEIVCSTEYFDKRYSEYFEERTHPLTDDLEKFQGFILVVRNISSIRQKGASEFQKKRFDIFEDIGSGLSHDFNNVFSGILNQLELIKIDDPDPTILKRIDFIEAAVTDGLTTVHNMENFTKSVKNIRFSKLEMKSIILDTISIINTKLSKIRFNQGVIIDPILKLEEKLWIYGDKDDIQNAVNNILYNSIDAMPEGGILNISAYPEDDNIILKISDTGIGMKDKVKEKIFDPFFTTKGMKYSGHGMGQIYGSMLRHGGSVEVDSVYGRGTGIKLIFPGYQPHEEEIEPDIDYTHPQAAKILVIDDEEYILNGVEGILFNQGHNIDTFQSALMALKIYQPGKYDVVIIDMGMPEMPGKEVARKIREMDPTVPIIIFSGWAIYLDDDPDLKGVVDIKLTKPFTLDELSSSISQALSLKENR